MILQNCVLFAFVFTCSYFIFHNYLNNRGKFSRFLGVSFLYNRNNLEIYFILFSFLYLINIFYSLIIIGFSYYLFECFICFIIGFYFSFLLCLFIFENYNFSSWFIIKINQIFVFCCVIITVISFFILGALYFKAGVVIDCFDLFNYIYCDGVDSVDSSNLNMDSPVNNNSDNTGNPSNLSNIDNKDDLVYTVKKEDVIVTSKEVIDSTVGMIKEVLLESSAKRKGSVVENVATSAGAGTAAGAIGSKIISSMPSGSSTSQKLLAGVSAAVLTAAGVGGAIKVVNAISKNSSKKESIKSMNNSDSSESEILQNSDLDRSVSPMEGFIPSVIERSEISSPLESLLEYQIYFGGLILIGILGLIMVLGLWCLSKFNLNILNYFLGSSLGNKLMTYSRSKININLIKNMNNKFFLSIIVIYSVFIIFCILIQLYINIELRMNIGDYIEVHNHIKNSGLGLLLINNINKIRPNSQISITKNIKKNKNKNKKQKQFYKLYKSLFKKILFFYFFYFLY